MLVCYETKSVTQNATDEQNPVVPVDFEKPETLRMYFCADCYSAQQAETQATNELIESLKLEPLAVRLGRIDGSYVDYALRAFKPEELEQLAGKGALTKHYGRYGSYYAAKDYEKLYEKLPLSVLVYTYEWHNGWGEGIIDVKSWGEFYSHQLKEGPRGFGYLRQEAKANG